jgi:hypothetical protein
VRDWRRRAAAAVRHLPLRHPEPGVHRAHHVVEGAQHVVGVVQAAVGQDVGLDPLQQAEARPSPARRARGSRRRSPGAACARRPGQPAGVAGRLRVVRDPQVAPAARPRRLRHLRHRGAAVGIGGVAVEGAAQVVHLHQRRQTPLRRGLHLAPPLAQLGGDPGEPSAPYTAASSGVSSRVFPRNTPSGASAASAPPPRAASCARCASLPVAKRSAVAYASGATQRSSTAARPPAPPPRAGGSAWGSTPCWRARKAARARRRDRPRGGHQLQGIHHLQPPPQLPGGGGADDAGEPLHQLQQGRRRLHRLEAAAAPPHGAGEGDALQDLLLGLRAEAGELGDPAGGRGLLQRVQRVDPQLRVQRADALRAQPLDAHQVEEPGGGPARSSSSMAEPVATSSPARRRSPPPRRAASAAAPPRPGRTGRRRRSPARGRRTGRRGRGTGCRPPPPAAWRSRPAPRRPRGPVRAPAAAQADAVELQPLRGTDPGGPEPRRSAAGAAVTSSAWPPRTRGGAPPA